MTWKVVLVLSISLLVSYKILPGIYGAFSADPGMLIGVLKDEGVLNSFRLSILWALFNSSLLVISATVLVWLFRERKKLLVAVLVIPWSVPMYLSVLSWRFAVFGIGGESLVSGLGLPNDIVTDPLTAFVWASIVNVWINLPVVALAISSASENLPGELVESASLDGASDSELFLNVYLPVVSHTTVGWFLMEFVRFVHSFTVPYLMTEGGPAGLWGMEGYGFVGSTTTLGVYNYEIFSKTSSIEVLNSYSTLTLVVVALVVSVWLFKDKRFIVLSSLLILEVILGLWRSSPVSFAFSLFLATSIFSKRIIRFGWIPAVFTPISIVSNPVGFDPILLVFSVWYVSTKLGFSRTLRLKIPVFKFLGIATAVFEVTGSAIVFLSILSTLSGGVPEPIPKGFSLEPFEDLLKDGYMDYVKNSLVLSIPTSILAPFLAFPVAYIMSRRNSSFLMTTFLVLQSIGGIHLLALVYSAYAKLKLLDELAWVVPMILSNVVPRISVSTKGFIDEVEKEIEDLAVIDGGKKLAMRMVFRLSLPAVIVGAIMGFSAGWNAFLAPLMFVISEEKYPVSVKLYDYAGDLMGRYPRWDLFGAGSVLNLVVISSFLMFTFLMRSVVEGSRPSPRPRSRRVHRRRTSRKPHERSRTPWRSHLSP